MAKNSAEENNSSNSASWLAGLVLGVCGGAALALLTTPQSGSEIRNSIKRKTQDVPDKFREVVDESLDLYASALNFCQLLIEEQTSGIQRAIAAGKLAAAKKREELELGGSSLLPFQHR